MDVERVQQLRRRMLPVWVVYTVAWVAWWGWRLTLGGGFESGSEIVTMALSGVAGLMGLLTGWLSR
jgi:hypothetical protein